MTTITAIASSPMAFSNTAPDTDLAWYGIHVRSRCEAQAHRELTERGFESFLPSRMVTRRWSDRLKQVPMPLFPGYIFCRFELPKRFRILNTPGVAQIVGAGRDPIAVSESEMQVLQTLIRSNVALAPWPYLKTGQRVYLERGPLAGVEGIVTHAEDGSPRVVVSISLLQRSVATQVEREWIGKVDPLPRAMAIERQIIPSYSSGAVLSA